MFNQKLQIIMIHIEVTSVVMKRFHQLLINRIQLTHNKLSLNSTQNPFRVIYKVHTIHTSQCLAGDCDVSKPKSEQRILRAAVIGAPNAGKSTLVNSLIGQKVFAVSPKVHTTQRRALGVFTEGNTQVLLVDTPGVIPYQYGRKLKMSKSLRTDAHRSVIDAEMIVVIVDASNQWTRMKLDPEIDRILEINPSIPSVLVLNKVDLLRRKHILLSITSSLTSPVACPEDKLRTKREGLWAEVFMVSALTGDGMDSLKRYLLSSAQYGTWQYHESDNTNQELEQLTEDVIREKLFTYLDKEIPYITKQETVVWEKKDDGSLEILKNLTCKKSSQVSILIGQGGKTIQTITAEAKTDLEQLWGHPVQLTLNVRSQRS